jgi:hypothetical protein
MAPVLEEQVRRLAQPVVGQLFVLDPGHLDVDVVRSQIGAVQQRP